MTPVATDQPVGAAQQALLDLFASDLTQLKFPDVDRAILEAAAQRVQADAEQLRKAEDALAVARQALQESHGRSDHQDGGDRRFEGVKGLQTPCCGLHLAQRLCFVSGSRGEIPDLSSEGGIRTLAVFAEEKRGNLEILFCLPVGGSDQEHGLADQAQSLPHEVNQC